MTVDWIIGWIASGFVGGVLFVIIAESILDGVDARRAHRRRVEAEMRAIRREAKAVTPF